MPDHPAVLPFMKDGSFLYGIKFGLAGVIAVSAALVIRLPEPTWALFTVFVLMLAQYFGAIAEKSILRIVGTIVGCVLGYLLTGAFQQSPFIFLPLVGGIVAFSTAMFGQSRYPYAFLLCGLSLVVVTSNGMGNPDLSWFFMIARTLEVCIGILAVILVQGILFPRYARLEFFMRIRQAFGELARDFRDCSGILFGGSNPQAIAALDQFPTRITALRNLLHFGARESQYFRKRLPTYLEITNRARTVAGAIRSLGSSVPPDSLYQVRLLREACEDLHLSMLAAIELLASDNAASQPHEPVHTAVDEAFGRVERAIDAIRHDSRVASVPTREAMTLGIHLLALDEIRVALREASRLIRTLPTNMGEWSAKEHEPSISPYPPPFWIRSGIKSGIAVVLAMILVNWLHPPGGSLWVLGAWVFVATNPNSPSGEGDARAFGWILYGSGLVGALCLVLLAATPMLSSFAVMLIVIFTWLFVWGYLSSNIAGITIGMQLGMLALVSILGLNAQQPVTVDAILGVFFGLVGALVVASLVQRLILPTLPQWELRDRFTEFLGLCRKMISEGPTTLHLWERTRIALIPTEAMVRISRLKKPICPECEPDRLRSYLSRLRRVAAQLSTSVGKIPDALPLQFQNAARDAIGSIDASMISLLDEHIASMGRGRLIQADPVPLQASLKNWSALVGRVREWMIANDYPIRDSLRVLGLAGRYRGAAADLIRATRDARRLRLADYMGDYEL